MDINLQEIQHRYAELSDEGLLEIQRDDLTELAQQYYDAELRARGLHEDPAPPVETPEPDLKPEDELVEIGTFLSMHEADMALTLLRSAEIPVQVHNEFASSFSGGGIRLLVPASYVEQAEEILASQISDEELLAQAEAAGSAETDSEDQ
jgi:hypothetical protein